MAQVIRFTVNHALVHRDRRAIVVWLAIAMLLVASMVLIGGYTRLSGSGLSITQWKLVHGTFPPQNDEQWLEEFAGYRASPQFQKINSGMTLEQFKVIYWPEYIHRVLGRAIGAFFLVPFIIFAYRDSFTRKMVIRLFGIFVLGGAQGGIGWMMVKSGLVDQPYVSHVRLALHLIAAFTIFALICWTLLDIVKPKNNQLITIPKKMMNWYIFWFAGLALQLVLGAFMAGLHAGLIYNTWPLMDGSWLPAGLSDPNTPAISNVTLIQFLHRNLAVLLAVGFLFWWYSHRKYVKTAHLGKVCASATAIIGLQFTLGVLTLVLSVPLPLALAHQMVALLLFTAAVVLLHGLAATKESK